MPFEVKMHIKELGELHTIHHMLLVQTPIVAYVCHSRVRDTQALTQIMAHLSL